MQLTLDSCSSETTSSVDETWHQVARAFNETSKETLGTVKSRPERVWLSAETWRLVEERQELNPKKKESEANTKQYNYLCREICRQSKNDKNTYLMELCQHVEKAHVQRKTKEVYDAVRKITGKQASRVHIVKDKDGRMLTDQKEVSNRWFEHNPHTNTDETVFAELPISNSATTDCPQLIGY